MSGISTEIFRQIEQVENDPDATTAAALESVERRGEMVVRILDPRSMGRNSLEAAKRFLQMQVQNFREKGHLLKAANWQLLSKLVAEKIRLHSKIRNQEGV